MTKTELIAEIAGVTEITKKQASAVLDALATIVTGALALGEEATIPGIGKVKLVDRPARKGRNPATGEEIDIAASRKVKIVIAKSLKDAAKG